MISEICDWLKSNSSGILAVLALATTAWQGYLQRKHNRLSVTPKLEIIQHRTPDGIAALTLKNVGVGPAIITEYRITADGTKLSFPTSTGLHAAFAGIGLKNPEAHWTCKSDTYIAANHSITLLKLDQSDIKGQQQHLKNIQLYFEYKSIYGVTFNETCSPLQHNST